ncbi:MAG: energy transducer TonB [Bacteroidetes bacterium]|nr:MAG: energy transducer TonB [Bacteroidota bacterium]
METSISTCPVCSRRILLLFLSLGMAWTLSAQTMPPESPAPDTLPPVLTQQDTSNLPASTDTVGQAEKQQQIEAEAARHKKAILELFGNETYGRSGKGSSGTLQPYSLNGTLAGRQVVYRPKMTMKPEYHKNGRVVVEVCVDNSGLVIAAAYRLNGSTTTDTELREQALTWARQFRFSPAEEEKACGVITFDFREK